VPRLFRTELALHHTVVLAFESDASVEFDPAQTTSSCSRELSRGRQVTGRLLPPPGSPWIATANGSIDSGAELFGSATTLATGRFAKNGFEALAELDSDHNGLSMPTMRPGASCWRGPIATATASRSAVSYSPVASLGVYAILSTTERQSRCDAFGNCERERSGLRWNDGSKERRGAAIDVYLRSR